MKLGGLGAKLGGPVPSRPGLKTTTGCNGKAIQSAYFWYDSNILKCKRGLFI